MVPLTLLWLYLLTYHFPHDLFGACKQKICLSIERVAFGDIAT